MASKSTSDFDTHSPPHPKNSSALVTRKRAYDRAFGKQKLEHGIPPSGSNIAESVSFLDALLANRVILETLTAEDILKFKYVSKSWASATNDSITIIGNVRLHNHTHDWYFPIFHMVGINHKVRARLSQIFHGIWHDSSSTSKLCKLPSLAYLPSPTDANDIALWKETNYLIRASSGGLLLVEKRNRAIRGKFHCIYSKNWPALIVTNPLTKLFQVLPLYDRKLRLLNYWSPQFYMIVDEIANSYKVVVLWSYKESRDPPQLLVYDSGSKKWEDAGLIQSPQQPSLGCWTEPLPQGWSMIYATMCTRGRLYLADIRMPSPMESGTHHLLRGVVRLFELVDIGIGQYILRIEIPLCQSYRLSVWSEYATRRCILRNLELVECIGHLYAVIPARLDEDVYQLNTYRQDMGEDMDTMCSTYMPLQFHIFKLEGDVEVEGHGVLRIEVPTTWNNYVKRRGTLYWKTTTSGFRAENWIQGENWFSCTARGSVIWVTIEDYLLQYDVLSRESTTQILPQSLHMEDKVGMAYQASFHMKP